MSGNDAHDQLGQRPDYDDWADSVVDAVESRRAVVEEPATGPGRRRWSALATFLFRLRPRNRRSPAGS
jgi:hypothetical protein